MKYGTHSPMQSTNAITTAVVQKSIAQLLPCQDSPGASGGPARDLVFGGCGGVSYRPIRNR